MRIARLHFMLLLAAAPALLWAAVADDELPPKALWYAHLDLDAMRNTGAGRQIYAWFRQEAFEEVKTEIGIDLDKEVDRITAFSAGKRELTVVLDGRLSQETQDKLVALGAASGSMDRLEAGGNVYYHVKDDSGAGSVAAQFTDDEFEPFENGGYFSFAIRNKLIVTSTEGEMQAMLAGKGRLPGGGKSNLLVLSADKSLLQAGLDAKTVGEDVGWDSNIVRNTEQLALLVADARGRLAVTAELRASEPAMASSLASIVRGLISLQVFNNDLDPDLAEVLRNTAVDVDGNVLKLTVSFAPEIVVAALE